MNADIPNEFICPSAAAIQHEFDRLLDGPPNLIQYSMLSIIGYEKLYSGNFGAVRCFIQNKYRVRHDLAPVFCSIASGTGQCQYDFSKS